MKLDLEQFIFALSDTVDLVGVDEILHGKRVAFMAWKCAKAMGFDEERSRRLFHLGLLHDCGVSSSEERGHLVQELEWDNSHIHSQIGAKRLESFEPLSVFAQPILYHHTRWERLKGIDLRPSIKTEANLIYLIDRIDYLCQTTPGSNMLAKKNIVRHKVNSLKEIYFSSELVDVFLEVSANEAFWFSLEPYMLLLFINDQKKSQQPIDLPSDNLKKIAHLFAEIVDAKSPYTAEHSIGVANLSRLLAEKSGLDKDTQLKVEVAGLLHDLGKLQVPDRVLESSEPLADEDLSFMRHHSYMTYRILNNIKGLEEIATWSGNHHEALDGSGYPFRRTAEELSIESRIIAIADIFQALAQTRPYRSARPLSIILDSLQAHSDRGRLDQDIVACVLSNSSACYESAIGA